MSYKEKEINNIPVSVFSSKVFSNMKDHITDLEICVNFWRSIVCEIEKVVISDSNNKNKIEKIKDILWYQE